MAPNNEEKTVLTPDTEIPATNAPATDTVPVETAEAAASPVSEEATGAPASAEEAAPATVLPTPEEALAEHQAKKAADVSAADSAESDWDGTLVNLDEHEEVDVDSLLASFRDDSAADHDLPLIIDEPAESQPQGDTAPADRQPAAESTEAAPVEEAEAPRTAPTSRGVTAEEYLIDTPAYMGLDGSTPKRKRKKRHPHFFYYIGEAFRGIFSHGFMSFAAIGIITACLLIMGTFSLLALNVNNEINQLMAENEFLAYVDEAYTTEEAMALQSTIEAIPNVSEVTFITRQEAYDGYVAALDDPSKAAELDRDTVFRDRFSVKVDDLEAVGTTSEEVAKVEGIEDISIDIEVANGFITVRNILLLVAAILVAILLVISLFIISNTIKLVTVSRRDEIAVMRMVGATSRFIRWPFIYQGAILGLVGAGVAFGLQTALYTAMCTAIESTGGNFSFEFIPFQIFVYYLLAVFLGSGLIIGVCGSSMAIRKFLKV